jgi:signal transduction histidine kinase
VSPTKGQKQVRITTGHILESHEANVGSIITLHDMTQEHDLEQMKLDFVSMAAHELRTPLTSIQGYLDVLSKEIKLSLTANQQLFLERIKSSAERLQFLIEDLLNVSRIERGQLIVNPSVVALEPIITQVASELSGRAKEKQLSLIVQKPQLPLPNVIADKSRIQEVLSNLIVNAIKYTDSGSITVSLEQRGNEIITHVKDTGIGIPKEALPHMFTKFFRVKDSLVQGRKGTGLGLYITKSIIDQHHGKVWIASESGLGSVFSFSLPIAIPTTGGSAQKSVLT